MWVRGACSYTLRACEFFLEARDIIEELLLLTVLGAGEGPLCVLAWEALELLCVATRSAVVGPGVSISVTTSPPLSGPNGEGGAFLEDVELANRLLSSLNIRCIFLPLLSCTVLSGRGLLDRREPLAESRLRERGELLEPGLRFLRRKVVGLGAANPSTRFDFAFSGGSPGCLVLSPGSVASG